MSDEDENKLDIAQADWEKSLKSSGEFDKLCFGAFIDAVRKNERPFDLQFLLDAVTVSNMLEESVK